jgi:hypothetical protein
MYPLINVKLMAIDGGIKNASCKALGGGPKMGVVSY